MKKIACIFLIIGLLLVWTCAAANAEYGYRQTVIDEIVKRCTDESLNATCSYNAPNDLLVYRLKIPASFSDYNSLPVETVGEWYDGFAEIADYMKNIVVEPFVPGLTTVTCVITSDNVPVAIFVNTADILRG